MASTTASTRATAGGLGPAARGPQAGIERADPIQARSGLFWALVLFLVLEYVRPSGIVNFKIQMVVSLALPVFWLFASEKPWSRILTAQVAFVGIGAALVPIASNYYAAYLSTRVMYANLAIAVSMAWLWSSFASLRMGILCWMGIMTYVALFGITHGGRGPGGFLGDENDLALACCTAFPFAFYGFERLPGWKRWASGAVAVLCVLAIVASFSRGGFLGLASVGLYCFLASTQKLRNLAVSLVSVLAFLALAPQDYLDEIYTIQETDEGTARARRFLWETAWNMWEDYPVFGVGGGNFNFLAGEYQPRDYEGRNYQDRDWSGQATHSAYFQCLSERGAVGTGLLLYIVFVHFRTIRRVRRIARSGRLPPDMVRDVEILGGALGAAIIGYLSAGAFLSVLYYPYPWYFSGMAVALEAAVDREVDARNRTGAGTRPAGEDPPG